MKELREQGKIVYFVSDKLVVQKKPPDRHSPAYVIHGLDESDNEISFDN